MPALNQLSSTVYRCGEYLQACFDAIKPVKPRDNHALVLEQQDFDSPWFAELVDQYTGWQQLMNLLIHQCSELKAELSGTDEEMAVNAVLQSLREGSENAYVVMEESPDRANTICWVSFKNGQPAALSSSSIRIGELLHERLFSRLKSLVMVSATLTIEDSFSYFIEKTGSTAWTTGSACKPSCSIRLSTMINRPCSYPCTICLTQPQPTFPGL